MVTSNYHFVVYIIAIYDNPCNNVTVPWTGLILDVLDFIFCVLWLKKGVLSCTPAHALCLVQINWYGGIYALASTPFVTLMIVSYFFVFNIVVCITATTFYSILFYSVLFQVRQNRTFVQICYVNTHNYLHNDNFFDDISLASFQ